MHRQKKSKVHKIKLIFGKPVDTGKVHAYMWLHTASIKSTVGNKIRLLLSPFHVSTRSRLTLAGAFRSDYVAACGTALRSATEENKSGSYVTVPCPYKVKPHSNTTDCLKF